LTAAIATAETAAALGGLPAPIPTVSRTVVYDADGKSTVIGTLSSSTASIAGRNSVALQMPMFAFDPDTGAVSLAVDAKIPGTYLVPGVYPLPVIITDLTWGASSIVVVNVTVVAVPTPPIVTKTNLYVSQLASVGTLIPIPIEILDMDGSLRNLTYLLVNCTPAGAVAFQNSSSNVLVATTAAALSGTVVVTVAVTAFDSAMGINVTSAPTKIVLSSIVPTQPDLSGLAGASSGCSTANNIEDGAYVCTISAETTNPRAALAYYELTQNPTTNKSLNGSDWFTISSETGMISLASLSALPSGTYEFGIRVIDTVWGTNSSAIIYIYVMNAIVPPSPVSTTFYVSSTATINSLLPIPFRAIDFLGRTNFTFALSGLSLAGSYSMDSKTGVIKLLLATALAAPVTGSVLITAVNPTNANQVGTAVAEIIIYPITITPPDVALAITYMRCRIRTTSPSGTSACAVLVPPANPDGVIVYSMVNVSASYNGSNYFMVNSTTGSVALRVNASAPGQAIPAGTYSVGIRADDTIWTVNAVAPVYVQVIGTASDPFVPAAYRLVYTNVAFATDSVLPFELTVVDPLPNRALSFEVASSNVTNSYIIDPDTGELTVGVNAAGAAAGPVSLTILVAAEDDYGIFTSSRSHRSALSHLCLYSPARVSLAAML
jgi:hypothetical protein